MLDEMAGNVLAVLMYIGAFRDLLRGCGGKGGRVFNHTAQPPSIKVACQNNSVMLYQKSFSFFSFFPPESRRRYLYLKNLEAPLASSAQTIERPCTNITSYMLKTLTLDTKLGGIECVKKCL